MADHTKALCQIKPDYESRISSLKADMVHVMEKGTVPKPEV